MVSYLEKRKGVVFKKMYNIPGFSNIVFGPQKVSRLINSRFTNYPGFLEIRSFSSPVLKSAFKIKKESSKRKKGKKQSNNLYRSRKTLKNIILTNANLGCSMLTLTFSEDIEFSRAKKELNLFIKTLVYRLGSLKYVWVAEKTKKGRVHFHILFFGIRKHSVVSGQLFKCGYTYYTPGLEKEYYILKYLTKSNDFINDLNSRVWGSSRGIDRSKEESTTIFIDGSLFGTLESSYSTPYGSYELYRKGEKECLKF